jgi:hypothetical protein
MLIIPTGFFTKDFGDMNKFESYGELILAPSRSFRRLATTADRRSCTDKRVQAGRIAVDSQMDNIPMVSGAETQVRWTKLTKMLLRLKT